jgi:hypothetical protein
MKKENLSKEGIFLGLTLSFSLLLSITGVVSYFFYHHIITQISSLIHLGMGILLSSILLPYLFVHFKRIYGIRRLSTFASGLAAAIVVLAMVISGWQILFSGSTQTNTLTMDVHIYSATIFVVISLLHIVIHFYSFSPYRKAQSEALPTLSQSPHYMKYLSIATVGLAGAIWLANDLTAHPYSNKPAVDDYKYTYGERPFLPSQTQTSNHDFIDERALATTQKCAQCHMDIVQQWNSSAHRQAASDRAYVTNITLLAELKGIEATRYCEGCHAPLALLTGQLSQGGIHGGISPSTANKEGVNCQSCHGISALVHTKGVASFHFDINRPYLFETASGDIWKSINRLALKHNTAQHKKDMLSPVQKTSQVCASCHAQFIDKDMNNWAWVKMQDDYSAWLDSPFAGNNDPQFAHNNHQRCQDCHMPMVPSSDPSANKNGMVRDHRFVAANTMLPTLNGNQAMLEATERFLQANKVRVSIEPPHRDDATINKMPTQKESMRGALQPFYYYKGEQANINVIVANVGVGHDFPAGTIDINQAWVAFQATDSEGNLVYSSGNIDDDDYLDQNAYQYRSIPVDRNGDHVWKHDLFNMVGKTSVNVVKAGQSDVVEFSFKVPYWVKGPISIATQVKYRKLNTRYAKWALQEDYQTLPITDVSRAQLQIPIRQSKKATTR